MILPFLPPVKNILTINTCKAAIATISPLSSKLNLNILPSVLRTVLKFLFSRVRKYFCCRTRVDTWPESFKIVSSTPESCSGVAPAFWGRLERASFSTCVGHPLCQPSEYVVETKLWTYGDFKVYKLVGNGRHVVVEAEAVLAGLIGGEDEVALTFLFALEDYSFLACFFRGAIDGVVDCFSKVLTCALSVTGIHVPMFVCILSKLPPVCTAK